MGGMPGMAHAIDTAGPLTRRIPPMPSNMGMMMTRGATPSVKPWLPGAGRDVAALSAARPGSVVRLADGDTLVLTAELVRREIDGRTFVMYGFNGQYPGPLIRVPQNATIVVRFVNRLDLPSTIHWHGLRLDNANDGSPGVTQDPVPPGGSFVYHVRFPDAGVYWYHPHVREDVEQNLGLYGNELVESPDTSYYSPVNREEPLLLNDVLMDAQGWFPYGEEAADFAIMGRFGNLFLVNGEPHYHLDVHAGDVVRFYVTDVSNARTYNLDFGGAPIKLVGADIGLFDHEEMVSSVPISVAQRYIVEVRFDRAGTFALTNRVQAIDHVQGEFFSEVDTLGTVTVSPQRSDHDYGDAFRRLRVNAAVRADIARYRASFDRPPDKQLDLTVQMRGLPNPIPAFMAVDTMYYPPVEWNDGMPDMNWVSTAREVRWILRDHDTGRENMDIQWTFHRGDVVKIRIYNDPQSIHPMQHPIHFHGQRFLVVSRNGVPNTNLVWKDTVLVPVGETVDILLDASNPGRWMAHCHIAEHLGSGMAFVFNVTGGT